jgi:hypothetical protein
VPSITFDHAGPVAAEFNPTGNLKLSKQNSTDAIDSAQRQGRDNERREKRQGFFAVDIGAFRCAAAGGLNAAIACLVMARGTGPDNRTTQWSVHSIEQRTGISRPNAAKAVKSLVERGIWKKTREGKYPIYEAVAGNEIPGGPFTVAEQAVIAAIRNGKPVPDESKAAAEALKARGIIEERQERIGRGSYKCTDLDEAAIAALTEPLAVWLPNSLIDGANGEVPPIELIRQTRSLPALRLLVELYAVQFLPNYGGVPRQLLKVVFERAKIGEQGPFVVWGFRRKHGLATWPLCRPFLTGQITMREDGTRRDSGWDELWAAVRTLLGVGLVEQVGMLLDGDDDEAEIIHPYGMRDGEPAERELASAAHKAALSMVTDGQRKWAQQNGYINRPHTAATAAWYGLMQKACAAHFSRYRALMQGRGTATPVA